MSQPLLQGNYNSVATSNKQYSSGKQSRVNTVQEYQFEEVPESAHPPVIYTSSDLYGTSSGGKKVDDEDDDSANLMS